MSFLKSKQPGYYCQAIAINKRENRNRDSYMQISAGRIREANFLKIVSVTKTHILQKGCLIVEYFFLFC